MEIKQTLSVFGEEITQYVIAGGVDASKSKVVANFGKYSNKQVLGCRSRSATCKEGGKELI